MPTEANTGMPSSTNSPNGTIWQLKFVPAPDSSSSTFSHNISGSTPGQNYSSGVSSLHAASMASALKAMAGLRHDHNFRRNASHHLIPPLVPYKPRSALAARQDATPTRHDQNESSSLPGAARSAEAAAQKHHPGAVGRLVAERKRAAHLVKSRRSGGHSIATTRLPTPLPSGSHRSKSPLTPPPPQQSSTNRMIQDMLQQDTTRNAQLIRYLDAKRKSLTHPKKENIKQHKAVKTRSASSNQSLESAKQSSTYPAAAKNITAGWIGALLVIGACVVVSVLLTSFFVALKHSKEGMPHESCEGSGTAEKKCNDGSMGNTEAQPLLGNLQREGAGIKAVVTTSVPYDNPVRIVKAEEESGWDGSELTA